MGSLAPEAGSGRKPPRGTAAPRDGARAPALSGTGSTAKGGRGQPAGSPPRSLSWPRAGGRVRPPGERRRGESARERAGRARARRAPGARAPPPGKQRARALPPRPPLPPRLPRNLLTARPGGAEPGGGGGRPQRAGVSRVPSASPGARALAQPSSYPPFFPKALGGATLRPEPGTAQPPPTFNVPHSPARASSASFFPSPPFPPPSCLHFLKEGFFSLSLPHTVAARERAGRAAEVRRRGRGAAWGAAGAAAAAVGEGAGAGSFVRAGRPRRRCPRAAAGPAGLLASLGARRGERCPRPPRGPPHKGPRSCVAAAAGRGSPPRARKFVALLGALFVCFA